MLPQCFPENVDQTGGVAGHHGEFGSVVYLELSHGSPAKFVAGMNAQFAQKLALSSPITVAEGMNGIELVKVEGGMFYKPFLVQATKMIFLGQVREQESEIAFEMSGAAELSRTQGQLARPHRAGPGIHIPKERPVNIEQVNEVESACKWSLVQM